MPLELGHIGIMIKMSSKIFIWCNDPSPNYFLCLHYCTILRYCYLSIIIYDIINQGHSDRFVRNSWYY